MSVPETSNRVTSLCRAELPSRGDEVAPEDGFVYVIEFSDKTIKVGRTRNLASRSASHRRDGEKFGLSITRQWGSKAHRGYKQTEYLIKAFAREHAVVQGGSEYFAGLDFASAVQFVNSLDLQRSTESEVESYWQRHEESLRSIRELTANVRRRSETHSMIEIDDKLAVFVLAQFFDSTHPLPAEDEEIDSELFLQLIESTQKIDSLTGDGRGDGARDWSTVEWLEYLLDLLVENAKDRLRARVVDESRLDMFDPWDVEVAS